MAELVFFSGTMDCGKSTLALQMDHNHRARGRGGLLFSSHDRAGKSMISSRLGLQTTAIEVSPATDFWNEIVSRRTNGVRVDYLICDEAQFYTAAQIEQLARIVDEMDIDAFAFGITSDFRTKLFPGSRRLIELADRIQVLQVEALCWCGRRATHNARTVNGIMVIDGDQMVVGDVEQGGTLRDPQRQDSNPSRPVAGTETMGYETVGYETLCRRHHMRRVTAQTANSLAGNEMPLPFGPNAADAVSLDRISFS